MLVLVLSSVNAQRGVPIISVNMKDGTKVQYVLRNDIKADFFDMNDVEDDEYVVCDAEFSTTERGILTVAFELTQQARDMKVDAEYGIDITYKSKDGGEMDSVRLYKEGSGRADPIYSDKKVSWLSFDRSYQYSITLNGKTYNDNSLITLDFHLNQGDTYILRAFVRKHDIHYSSPVEVTMPKFTYGQEVGKGKYVVLDSNCIENLIDDNLYLFGKKTDVACYIVNKYWKEFFISCSDLDAELAKADSTDVCFDGTDYYFKHMTHADEIIALIKQNALTDYYLKATPYTLAPFVSSSTQFGTKGLMQPITSFAVMMQCGSEWGVPDNEYLLFGMLTSNVAKPSAAFLLNGIMLPGKTYNITFTLAPQTDKTDTEKLPFYFYVYVLEGRGDSYNEDTFPSIYSSNRMVNPTDPTGMSTEFVAEADKLTSYTVKYSPTKLVYQHGIEIGSSKSYATSANRQTYCQHPRIVGVKVELAE